VRKTNAPELTRCPPASDSHDELGYTYHREPGLWPDCLVAHTSGCHYSALRDPRRPAGRLYIIGESSTALGCARILHARHPRRILPGASWVLSLRTVPLCVIPEGAGTVNGSCEVGVWVGSLSAVVGGRPSARQGVNRKRPQRSEANDTGAVKADGG
jgi:hypothetical protein